MQKKIYRFFLLVFISFFCTHQATASVLLLTNALQTLKAKLVNLSEQLGDRGQSLLPSVGAGKPDREKKEDRERLAEEERKKQEQAEKDPILALLNEILELRKKHEKALLKPLTEQAQRAGVNDAEKYYDSSILDRSHQRISLRNLHIEGNDKMTNEELQQIFFLGVFQYYTNEFLQFNMNLKHLQIITSLRHGDTQSFQSARAHLFGLLIYFGLPTKNMSDWWTTHNARQFITTVQESIASFKKNVSLAMLGEAFQRWKIVIEKVEEPLISADRLSDLLKIDRISTDLQIMIYHWMQEGYEKFRNEYKQNHAATGEFLAEFKPSFLSHPYYAKIISQLTMLTQPVTEIAGINIKSR